MANINTIKSVAEQNNLKHSDPWGFALSKISRGASPDIEDGDKYYRIPNSEPLSVYMRRFPQAKTVSIEEINTPSKTQRVLHFVDYKFRVIHSTQNVELIDDEIFISLPRQETTCWNWLLHKMFGRRLQTRHQMKFKANFRASVF
jgi:hypothetical protein